MRPSAGWRVVRPRCYGPGVLPGCSLRPGWRRCTPRSRPRPIRCSPGRPPECDFYRMKVLHAAKFYPPALGGMETFVQYLCEGTAAGWDVCAVVANESCVTVEERRGLVRVVRTASLGTVASVPICPSLPFHLWRETADCIVLHEPNPVAASALFLRIPARRLIIWHHSDLVRPWWAPYTYGIVQRTLYRRADCVVVSN